MADSHTSPRMDKDAGNKPLTPEAQVLHADLTRLIAINRNFCILDAIFTCVEINLAWPDLQNPPIFVQEINNLAQVLRQANIVVEARYLRDFLVVWKASGVDFWRVDVTRQAKLVRNILACQLGVVEKQATTSGDQDRKVDSTPYTKKGKEEVQTLSPGNPANLLSKTHKKGARQHQHEPKSSISSTKKSEKRKRGEELENDDTATQTDDATAASMDNDESELNMEPITLSAAEKEAITSQKLERKRKLEALASKQKRRRYL